MTQLGSSFVTLIALCVALCIATPSLAQPNAQVGYLHADGTVQINVNRFQPTLAVTSSHTLPVASSSLYVSNGFLSLLRMADDQCTSENTQLYFYDSVGGTFEPIAASVPSGKYGFGSQVGPNGFSGPVYAVEMTVSISPFLSTCYDDGCEASQDGACIRMFDPGNYACACVWSITLPNGLPGIDHNFSGCRLGIDLRPFWHLHHSVLWQHIQNP